MNWRLQNLQTNCFFGLDDEVFGGDLEPEMFEVDTDPLGGINVPPPAPVELLRSFDTMSIIFSGFVGLKYKSLLRLRNSRLTVGPHEDDDVPLLPVLEAAVGIDEGSELAPSKLVLRMTG